MKTAQCQNYKISVRILKSQEGSVEFRLGFPQVQIDRSFFDFNAVHFRDRLF